MCGSLRNKCTKLKRKSNCDYYFNAMLSENMNHPAKVCENSEIFLRLGNQKQVDNKTFTK